MKTNTLSDEILKRLNMKNDILSESFDANDIMKILEELNIYEIELVAQNQELLEKEEQLLEANNVLASLFYDAPISYIVTDEKFNIIKFNKKSQKELMLNTINPKFNNFMSHIEKSYLQIFFK